MSIKVDLDSHLLRARELATHGDYISSGMIQQLVAVVDAMDKEIKSLKEKSAQATAPSDAQAPAAVLQFSPTG